MPKLPSAKTTIRRMNNLKKSVSGLPQKDFFRLWNLLRDDLYKTPEYQMMLANVRLRASYMCEGKCCRKKGRQVHHMISVYKDPEQSLSEDNCKFLCIKCHKDQHKGERAARMIRDTRFKQKQSKR